MAHRPSSTVAGKKVVNSVHTLSCVTSERPMSPCSNCHS